MKRVYVAGVGPDAPTVVNDKGAKQSATPYKFTDFDPSNVLRVAAVSGHGFSKYGPRNYLGIPALDHIDHALAHINAFLAGDPQEDHLAHAICRLYFAMATSEPAIAPAPVATPLDLQTKGNGCPHRTTACPTECQVGIEDPCPLDPFDERNRK